MLSDKEFIKTNSHISTGEVMRDIRETEQEIKEYVAMKVLQPKLSSAYESRIKKHEDFVKRLNHLLKLRGEK